MRLKRTRSEIPLFIYLFGFVYVENRSTIDRSHMPCLVCIVTEGLKDKFLTLNKSKRLTFCTLVAGLLGGVFY